MSRKSHDSGIFNTSTVKEANISAFATVYYYLFAGIAILISVFLFIPRIAVG